MGQLYCHTKPPSESRCVTVHPDQCPLQSYRLQTIKRFAQMLIDFTKKNVPSIRSETVTEGRL